MKNSNSIVFAIGKEFDSNAELIYNSILSKGIEVELVLFVFPTAERIKKLAISNIIKLILIIGVTILPSKILKLLFSKYIPKLKNVKFVKDINSKKAISLLSIVNPRIIVLYGCGRIARKTCELFHNVFINAHAGKLPEYRGVSNIEWCYYEDKDLFGTIQFTSPLMDSGDIVLEKEIPKVQNATDINTIRMHGFSETYNLVSEAIHCIINNDCFFAQKQISSRRTNRYAMHPYIKNLIQAKMRT